MTVERTISNSIKERKRRTVLRQLVFLLCCFFSLCLLDASLPQVFERTVPSTSEGKSHLLSLRIVDEVLEVQPSLTQVSLLREEISEGKRLFFPEKELEFEGLTQSIVLKEGHYVLIARRSGRARLSQRFSMTQERELELKFSKAHELN